MWFADDLGSSFYVSAFATLFIIAMFKGAFGGGFALIGVPVLSIFISPVRAATIIAPLVCLMDLFALMAYPPRTWNRSQLKILIPGAFIGMAFGAVLLGRAPEVLVGLVVGAIAVAFSLQWLAARFFGLRSDLADSVPRRRSGLVWGAISGFTSLLAHAGGPPLSVYLLRQRLPKTELAGTQTVFFMIGNYMKLVPYLLLGQTDSATWKAVVLISPAVPLGVAFGRFLHGRLDQQRIYLGCYLLTLSAGAHMLFKGLLQIL